MTHTSDTELYLTFEEQQEIDRLAKLAYTPSSNSNKHRYNLYGYIEGLLNVNKMTPEADTELDEIRKAIVNRMSKIQLYAKDSQEITASDEADIERYTDELISLIAKEVEIAKHEEHFKTHCVTCGKYNQIDRPEDEDICQCE